MKRLLSSILLLSAVVCSIMAQITGTVSVTKEDLAFSEQDEYDVIRLKDSHYTTTQTGAPELPVIIKTFVLPQNKKVTALDINVGGNIKIKGKYMPFPVQPPITVGENNEETGFTEPDPLIYNGTTQYPGKYGEIVADYYEMGYHLVRIMLCPVAFDPVSRGIYLNSISFSLKYESCEPSGIQPEAQSNRRASMIKKYIKSLVDNPQDVDGSAKTVAAKLDLSSDRYPSSMTIDAISEQIPDYIIITNNALKSEFQRLAQWKTQKGVPTIIKDTESIAKEYEGADLQERIKNYLRDCYKRWGSGLFVLLGGDTNIIPARQYPYDGELHPSDAYYTVLEHDWNTNKNHIYGEGREYGEINLERKQLFIGRAPVENKTETTLFINKVLAYEKMSLTSVDKSYLMNHLAASAYITLNNGILRSAGKDSINTYLSTYPQLNKWYLFDHYNCKCSKHEDKKQYSTGEELSRTSFISALNDGGASGLNHFHIVYHMDHSHPVCMGASERDKNENIFISDVDNLTNGDYLQIVISGGCNPANFNYDCIAEQFVNNPNGGAVAFIGNSNVGYASEYRQYRRFLDALYKYNIYNLGYLYFKMIGYTDTTRTKLTSEFYRLHLLGDPEMPVWSAVPQELDISVTPSIIAAGENTIKVRINNLPEGEEATVCLMKDAEAYASVVISDTNEHSFSFTPKTQGTMTVTATARNFIPKVRTISVNPKFSNQISISKIKNFKGKIGTGNTAGLNIVLKNNSAQTANEVTARLSTTSPYIDIDKSSITYNNILPGKEKETEESFIVTVADNAPEAMRNDWNAACFYLNIINEETRTICVDTFRVDIVSHKARIEKISRRATSGGNVIPQAGDQVTLDLTAVALGEDGEGYKMNGKFPGTIITNRTKWEAYSKTPDINNINIINNVCRFTVSDSYQGDSLPIKIRLLYDNIPHDSITFDAFEAVPAADISTVHKNITDHSISFYWDKMDGAPKYNIYRSNSENGTYAKLNKLPLTTRYYEDAGLTEYSTYYYKFSALTESNMESPLSQPIKAWTSYPLTMRKRAPTKEMYAFDSEVGVADIDLDGQKEIVLNSHNITSYYSMADIIVLNHDGSELYGTQDAGEACSGFAYHDVCYTSVPSVADLYGNGEPAIISFSAGKDDTGKYNGVCYSAADKNGDGTPDRLWLTPLDVATYRGAVVTDIDRPDDKKGRKEIILLSNENSIMIFNADGTLRRRFGENVAGHYGCLAVADLNGDGYKEIICGDGSGNLYVWQHDGSPYLRSPFFTREGKNLMSSPVICDFDGDGQKEIIIASRDRESYIYVIRQDGTCIGSFDSNSPSPASIEYAGTMAGEGLDHAVTTGDINGDGMPEIIALGAGKVRAWRNNGTILFDTPVAKLFESKDWATHLQLPLLADVDGDAETDIVFNNGQMIYALHGDGTEVKGFPLTTEGDMIGSVCVADLDGDGRNEIISADRAGYISTWKTQGTTVVWGRTRFDTGFTGEYRQGAADPAVITAATEWQGGTSECDIYISSGRLLVPANKELRLGNNGKIIVMNGGELEIDGGSIADADILVKTGGTLRIKNGGKIVLSGYGMLDSEPGAMMDIPEGEVR